MIFITAFTMLMLIGLELITVIIFIASTFRNLLLIIMLILSTGAFDIFIVIIIIILYFWKVNSFNSYFLIDFFGNVWIIKRYDFDLNLKFMKYYSKENFINVNYSNYQIISVVANHLTKNEIIIIKYSINFRNLIFIRINSVDNSLF